MRNSIKIFSGNSNPELSRKIVKYLGVKQGKILVSRFKDGETRVQILQNTRGKDVFIIQSICGPANDNLMELLIMIDAAKRASARRITAVIPYYGYARQDKKKEPRVPITAKLVADLITKAGAHRVITLDLHAAQIQGFFDIPVDNLYARYVFDQYIRQNFKDPIRQKKLVIVSPDAGGVERARSYASRHKVAMAIIDKRRAEANMAKAMHVIGDVRDRESVILDDIVDTGNTTIEAATALINNGAKSVHCIFTHGVLSEGAIEKLENSCIKTFAFTNSIPLKSGIKSRKLRTICISGLIGEAIRRVHMEQSVNVLFK